MFELAERLFAQFDQKLVKTISDGAGVLSTARRYHPSRHLLDGERKVCRESRNGFEYQRRRLYGIRTLVC